MTNPIANIRIFSGAHIQHIMNKVQIIATDGGSIKNGKPGCRASFAVIFGRDDKRNRSGEVIQLPSNQRAELTAITTAIDMIDEEKQKEQKYVILTDSDYGMKCFTSWAKNWMKNDWQNAKKQPVKHRDLIEPAYLKYLKFGPQVSFKHIRSHRTAPVDKNSVAYQEWSLNDLADRECANILKMRR